ncbi:hypothetical protein BGZ74_000048 [Mortierella antarctica]|nr:hypothetical protein BGZ74_000048 [Mortierella antarctica]
MSISTLINECLTTDGTYLYGFSQPYYGYISNTGNSSAFALIRSNPNPTSATSLTWTLLNAIEAGGHIFLGDQQYCTIDDKGVFSVFSPESYERGQHYLLGLGPKGIRFTPGGPNPKSDTQGSMSGTWKNFNLTGYEQHRWEAHITNAVFNHKDSTGVNTLMHAAVNKSSSEDIRLSAMNPQETELAQGQQSFKLDPNTSGSRYVSLGFANGNLHVFGQHWRTDGQGQVLAMTIIPITSTSTYIPTNSMYTTLNATLIYSRCASTSGYQNANLGKDLVINCWSVRDEQAYFFHYDGTSIRELGNSENAGFYEIMTMVPVGKSTSFEIFMLLNSATTVITA